MSLCLAVLLVFGGSGLIYAGIQGSAHDWSYQTGRVGTGSFWRTETQICRPCHVPHNLSKQPMRQLRLIWAQAADWAEPISLWFESELWWSGYRNVPQVEALPAALEQIGGTRFGGTKSDASIRFCLSCHADRAFVMMGAQYTFNAAGNLAAVGPSLRSDHPVNVDLGTPIPGSIQSPTIPTVKLVEGRVTCSTCHSVHNEGGYGDNLLTYTMTGSRLCLECHPK